MTTTTRFVFTFGCGSPLARYYVEIHATDEGHARARMVALFSTHWAGVYQGDRADWVVRGGDGGPPLLRLVLPAAPTLRLGTNHDELPRELYAMAWTDGRVR